MTIPLSIFYFHQIPTFALISNIFVIYLAIIIISLALFSLVFIAFTPIFEFLASILNHLINELILIVTAIAEVPYSSLINLYISPIELIIIYSALLFFILYKELQKTLYFKVSVICLLFFFMNDHFEDYQLKHSKKLFIYSTQNDLTINLISNDTSFIYTSDTSNIVLDNLNRSLKNNWGINDVLEKEIYHLNEYKNHRLTINNQSILILNTDISEIDKHIYDYILINNSYISLNSIKNKFIGKKYIIGSKVSPIQARALENQNRLFKLHLTTAQTLYFE
jgi:competence protein ComEC